MPVTVGTRLERLRILERQVRLQIKLEERAELTRVNRSRGSRSAVESQAHRLAWLGVTSLDVKRWAAETGLVPAVTRGRCAERLIDAYEAAHE